jgi:hypothetical protein
MIKRRHTWRMSTGLIVLLVFLALVAFAPLLTRSGDLDDRDRRGWWVDR